MKNIWIFSSIFFIALPVMAEGPTGQNAATTLLVLLAIIALILGVAKVVKRLQLPSIGAKGGIKMISQMPLGQRERILLLEVNGEHLLVGITPHQINLIKKLDTPIQLEEQSDTSQTNKDD